MQMRTLDKYAFEFLRKDAESMELLTKTDPFQLSLFLETIPERKYLHPYSFYKIFHDREN